MHVIQALAVPARGGYYFDDQAALREGRDRDGFMYSGAAVTPGFTAVRQPSEAVSLLLLLDDGHLAHGDCVSNQYAGAGGRDRPLQASRCAAYLRDSIIPSLRGMEVTCFRQMIKIWEEYDWPEGQGIKTAARYGLSQAILDAVAHSEEVTMAEIVAREYGLDMAMTPIPIFAQSGEEVLANVDKMILRRVACMPHGLISSPEKVGPSGSVLRDTVAWVVDRVERYGGQDYRPIYHFDVYGLLGQVFDGDVFRVADYLADLWTITDPSVLRIEYPMVASGQDELIDLNRRLRQRLRRLGVPVMVSVDEWCNSSDDIARFAEADAADLFQVKAPVMGCLTETISAVTTARRYGLGAYLGGSCTETDRSAQVCAHIALATRPDEVLAKPGMGVDEGVQIVHNEMARAIALAQHRGRGGCKG